MVNWVMVMVSWGQPELARINKGYLELGLRIVVVS